MTEALTENLMAYLTPRRTASVGNLATHFDCALSEITPVVENLISEGRLRLSASRCAGSCGSCTGCESSSTAPLITEQTIAISLDKKETDE